MNYKDENSLTDQTLVEKVLRGETSTFNIIIKNTERLVAQIIFKMIPNHEDRKDIAQDVYLKVFQKLKGFKFQSKLSTWIGQIAFNTCLNYLEKKKVVLLGHRIVENETNVEIIELISNKAIDKSINETEDLIFKNEIAEILKIEIDKLPPLFKTLVTLYHNEELNTAEIVQITGLPEGTIKNYLFRARKILKENLLLNYKIKSL